MKWSNPCSACFISAAEGIHRALVPQGTVVSFLMLSESYSPKLYAVRACVCVCVCAVHGMQNVDAERLKSKKNE